MRKRIVIGILALAALVAGSTWALRRFWNCWIDHDDVGGAA